MFPTAVSRDATVLPQGKKAVAVTGAAGGVLSQDSREEEALRYANALALGGLIAESAFREGLGGGTEQAFRVGAGTVGAYGGYERAYGREQAGVANMAGFWGGLGGAHYTKDGAYPFVQPYAGLVMEMTTWAIRPGLAMRVAAQTGLVSRDQHPKNVWYGYAIAFGTAEPRLRLAAGKFSVVGGLTIGYGFGRCQECFDTIRMADALIISPSLGFALDAN